MLVPWLISLAGTVSLAMVIWLFGPLLAALQDWPARATIIAILLLAWLGSNSLGAVRRRRRERALQEGLVGGRTALRQEQDDVAQRLAAALDALKASGLGRGALYQRPWYAIIGPPGAGKTTALLNAGLDFPLADTTGPGPVAGAGGTRLCDWWFTDTAVLIDTAGRYTTQDSDAAIDKAGWEAFLALLRRARPRQPLNGLIVAIGLDELSGGTPIERGGHAQAVRARIDELEQHLGTRMPIYVWFTKADLIAGFTEFFEDLDRDGRAQVWGVTFPPPAAGVPDAASGFAAAFGVLVERVQARLYGRLNAERSGDRRAQIAGFPAQLASLQQPLAAFVTETFAPNGAGEMPWLRGVYVSSATQEGTPVDRLIGSMARAFGLDERRPPSLRPERGRSYFLTGLLAGVIFGEAMLVRERPAAAARRRQARIGGFALLMLLVLAGCGGLLAARRHARGQIDAAAQALAQYETVAAAVTLTPVGDADLPRLLPLLDAARDLAALRNGGGGFGLSQAAKLQAGAAAVYRHALGYGLLPRMVWRLEAQMRGSMGQPDVLYEATRVYLMLGGEGPLDRQLVRSWMTLDWQAIYGVSLDAQALHDLDAHLAALLAAPLPPISLDGGLVAAARATFRQVSPAAQVYARLRTSAAAAQVPDWRPGDVLGPLGATLFIRGSGKPFSDGVPGFLTAAGFHQVLLPGLAAAAAAVASEGWVMGRDAHLDLSPTRLRDLEQSVIGLYEADYARTWDAMLQDIQLVPLRSLTQAAQTLFILSAPQSPLRSLMTAVAAQLTLAGSVGASPSRRQAADDAAASEQTRLARLLGSADVGAYGTASRAPGHEIDDQFGDLRTFVDRDAGAALGRALQSVIDLQQQLAKMAAAPLGSAPPPITAADDPSGAVRAQARAVPQPLARWLLAIADQGAVLRGGGGRQQIAAAYNVVGGPAALCAAVVDGRFPFTPGSTQDVAIDDFARLLAPGGLIDGFLNTQLQPYIDTTAAVWAPRSAGGVTSPVAAADAIQFQRAARLRDLFFAAGSSTPGFSFDITPLRLDNDTKAVSLELDGSTVTDSHGTPTTTQIDWPGSAAERGAQLAVDPPPADGSSVLAAQGPWALFRMLTQGRLTVDGSTGHSILTFRLGVRTASFDIHSRGAGSPLDLELLASFRCPVVQ